MQRIELDGSDWRLELDFYEALAAALGSVEWHGLNANAFEETMIYYLELNEVQPPYEIVIRHAREPMRSFAMKFASWIAEAREDRKKCWGSDVEVAVKVL
jgi:hypothetical protein